MTDSDDIIALKELITERMSAIQILLEQRIASIEKATIIANATMEKRLESMNEFRAQLKDQTITFITRTDHDNLVAKLDVGLKEVKDGIQKFISRAEYESQIEKLETEIKELQLSRANLEGKASQSSVAVAYILSGIGLLLSIIGVILNLAKAFGAGI
jgi:hypothetical protein